MGVAVTLHRRLDDDSNPEMIIVFGFLSACWCMIGFLIGLFV